VHITYGIVNENGWEKVEWGENVAGKFMEVRWKIEREGKVFGWFVGSRT
jgi:hypothetical protein